MRFSPATRSHLDSPALVAFVVIVAMATLAGQLIADAIAGEAEKFDLFGKIPTRSFPGGDYDLHLNPIYPFIYPGG